MKLLLALFTLENLVCCIPIAVLSYNIHLRNQFLYEFFPPVIEEKRATVTAYSLATLCPVAFLIAPFLQFWLFKLYHLNYHPWSVLLNPEKEKGRLEVMLERLVKKFWKKKDSEDFHRDFWQIIEEGPKEGK
jgi:hypothetical protein